MVGQAPFARNLCASIFLIAFMLCVIAPANARNLTFALIPKDIEDVNFINAWRGCSDAARRNGDECRQIGDTQVGYFRGQLAAIHTAIELDVDGMAISVTNSSFIGEDGLPAAQAQNIPIITYDSDLEPAQQHFRRTYIGPDNFGIGLKLGQLMKSEFPSGATVCLMSGGRFDPNLNDRIEGIRYSLRQTSPDDDGDGDDAPDNTTLIPLVGENGWKEHPRCPLYNRGDESLAQTQFAQAIQVQEIELIVPVGAWLLGDTIRLERTINALPSHPAKLIMATGTPSPEQDDMTLRGVIDGYVAIDFYAMGELVYQQMRNYAAGHDVVVAEETPLRIRRSSELKPDETGM